MKKDPKVSIIIPVYNAEKYIMQLIDSLLNLNYNNYKINLIIDKNSKDKSEKIARNFAKQDKKIKIILNNKNGSAANRNKGVLESDKDTKYFAFTDSDCYVHKNWLKILVDTIEKTTKNIQCVGGINLTPHSDNSIAKLTGKIEQTKLGGGNTAQTKIFRKLTRVNSIPNCNALYKKDIWANNKQDESLITGQDGEFNYRILKKGGRFLINPKAIVWHHRPSTLKKYLKRMYNYGKASSKILFKQNNKINFIKSRWYGFIPPLFFSGIILLLIISLLFDATKYIIYLGITPYIFAILLTSTQVIIKDKSLNSLLTPFILISQHISYSWGVIKELFR
jgi:glycosyltransferase involved in cell wall biosynthesis